ncbi:MAG: (Fe-S)-binding protein [Acidimicrobiales bacterium]
MPLPTEDVVGVLADNLRRRGSVLPIPVRRAARWARELDLPRGGPTVLYTGMMYQLVPHIERLVAWERYVDAPAVAKHLGPARLKRVTGLARRANRHINGLGLIGLLPVGKGEHDRVPANVALLLRQAGVSFGYLYEDDLYAGTLAWDLGAREAVTEHARKVAAIFVKHGVREVITIDPHTTHMLRSVYPELVPGYDVTVRSYLEVLAERGFPSLAGSSAKRERVTVHDSCVYARYEGVVGEPRALLQAAGLNIVEPENSKERTWCCGGPAESLYPEKAAAVAATRVGELSAAAPQCVTMCPICLVNLRKAADGKVRFRDISDYLVEALGTSNGPAGAGGRGLGQAVTSPRAEMVTSSPR